MAGNVWEWTHDWYADHHPAEVDKPCCVPSNPGSFLCADNYCQRYRPAARQPQMIDTGMSHVGFRTIKRKETK